VAPHGFDWNSRRASTSPSSVLFRGMAVEQGAAAVGFALRTEAALRRARPWMAIGDRADPLQMLAACRHPRE